MTKDEALHLASVVLDHCYGQHTINDNMIEQTAKVIQSALKAKGEPYAFEASMYSNDRMKVDPVTGNVSIGTPQRTWVGLTDEELTEAMKYWSDDSNSSYGGAYAAEGEYFDVEESWRYIEAKLKAKNETN